jgi:RNase P/RNase MRP subunit p29
MQQVELRTSTRRHVCGKGVIVDETKRYIKVQVLEVVSTITRVKPGDVIKFSKLDGRSTNGFALGL